MGFVDGLFEMYKLRESIAKARAELLSESVISSYTHRIGFFFSETTSITDPIWSNLSLNQNNELEKAKKMEVSLMAYEFLILQHAALICILEKKYDTLLQCTTNCS